MPKLRLDRPIFPQCTEPNRVAAVMALQQEKKCHGKINNQSARKSLQAGASCSGRFAVSMQKALEELAKQPHEPTANDNGKPLKKVCATFVELCREMGLLATASVAIGRRKCAGRPMSGLRTNAIGSTTPGQSVSWPAFACEQDVRGHEALFGSRRTPLGCAAAGDMASDLLPHRIRLNGHRTGQCPEMVPRIVQLVDK
jgi:hypothetical protein